MCLLNSGVAGQCHLRCALAMSDEVSAYRCLKPVPCENVTLPHPAHRCEMPTSDHRATSPLFLAPAPDTVVGISRLLAKYGLDCDQFPRYTKPPLLA